ncbi:unnamed protein product [Prunus armeniaca]
MGKEETRGRRSKEVDLVLMGGNLKMQSHHFVAVRLNDQTGTILGFVVYLGQLTIYLALMATIGEDLMEKIKECVVDLGAVKTKES